MTHPRLLVLCLALLLGVLAGAPYAAGQVRTWRDASGAFALDATLVQVADGLVTLRRQDGRLLDVRLDRLSEADRAFLESAATPDAADRADAVAAATLAFYGDLRTKDRTTARDMLTTEAQQVAEQGKSPLEGLPEPDEHRRAIRLGKVKIEDNTAEAPVRVRAGGNYHKTKLHLRWESDQWRVFAISATFPDGEQTVSFETPAGEAADPLAGLVGQPLMLQGVTLSGAPVDLRQLRGRVVLVDFWATWCGPCREELPNIRATWDKHHEAGFEVIAVSIDRDLQALTSFVAREKPPWTVVADRHPRSPASMAAQYGIRSIPAFILVGPDGRVAAVQCRGEQLGREVAKLLAEKDQRGGDAAPR